MFVRSDWACGSVAEPLPSMLEALDLILGAGGKGEVKNLFRTSEIDQQVKVLANGKSLLFYM